MAYAGTGRACGGAGGGRRVLRRPPAADFHALRIRTPGRDLNLVLEVAEHVGDNVVRCIAMSATRGLSRGVAVEDTGSPIRCRSARSVWAGSSTCWASPSMGGPLGRSASSRFTRPPPPSTSRCPPRKFYETGIKAIDLLAPFRAAARSGCSAARGGQDAADHGTDPQHHHGARRPRRVRRRGRAHPRGQRSVAGDEGIRRAAQHRAGVRADERAARRPAAGGALGADQAEYFRDDMRQDVLLFIDNIFRFVQAGRGGVGPAGAHALRRRLPAHAGHRDGHAAGAHHLHQARLDHLGAGGVRAGRRHHRSGAGHHVRASGRHDRARPQDRRDGHLSRRRAAGCPPRAS
jgi:F-type H+/Na+-transporting ATPase subunit beta